MKKINESNDTIIYLQIIGGYLDLINGFKKTIFKKEPSHRELFTKCIDEYLNGKREDTLGESLRKVVDSLDLKGLRYLDHANKNRFEFFFYEWARSYCELISFLKQDIEITLTPCVWDEIGKIVDDEILLRYFNKPSDAVPVP